MLKSDVKKYYGSFVKAAQALGVSPSAISQWGDVIPEKQAYRLENLTQGKLSVDLSSVVTRQDLRPDLFE